MIDWTNLLKRGVHFIPNEESRAALRSRVGETPSLLFIRSLPCNSLCVLGTLARITICTGFFLSLCLFLRPDHIVLCF
jgi:hypothetical protein